MPKRKPSPQKLAREQELVNRVAEQIREYETGRIYSGTLAEDIIAMVRSHDARSIRFGMRERTQEDHENMKRRREHVQKFSQMYGRGGAPLPPRVKLEKFEDQPDQIVPDIPDDDKASL